MKVSAGIIIIDDSTKTFLVATPTHKWKQRDIPKGKIESGETPIQAAIRETFEETGLSLKSNELKDLGEMAYSNDKNIHLFVHRKNFRYDTKAMYCSTYVKPEEGKPFPEMAKNGYEYIGLDSTSKLYPSMQNALVPILKDLFA